MRPSRLFLSVNASSGRHNRITGNRIHSKIIKQEIVFKIQYLLHPNVYVLTSLPWARLNEHNKFRGGGMLWPYIRSKLICTYGNMQLFLHIALRRQKGLYFIAIHQMGVKQKVKNNQKVKGKFVHWTFTGQNHPF